MCVRTIPSGACVASTTREIVWPDCARPEGAISTKFKANTKSPMRKPWSFISKLLERNECGPLLDVRVSDGLVTLSIYPVRRCPANTEFTSDRRFRLLPYFANNSAKYCFHTAAQVCVP